MAHLTESATWEDGVYQLETSDPVQGGPDGIDNLQAKQLANRTSFLKQEINTNLEKIIGSKPVELAVDLILIPTLNQYPKLSAFEALFELPNNDVIYTVKSFYKNVEGDCVITFSNNTQLVAKKLDAASCQYVNENIQNRAFMAFVDGAIRSNADRAKDKCDIREFENLVSTGLWNDAFAKALTQANIVMLPNRQFDISDTLALGGRGMGIMGYSDLIRNFGNSSALIKWRGGNQNRKAVIQVGQNGVGEEPLIDATDLLVKNLVIDCGEAGHQAGFGLYGTYLTNESLIDRVSVYGSTEYNFYFAKAWYASFKNLVSLNCENNGVALGMPLRYADNTLVNWTSPAPLEINACQTNNLRAHSAGRRFSITAPKTFNPTNLTLARHGWGMGLGVGNSFHAYDVLSEGSGGFNLYCYTDFQPIKTIKKVYLEGSCNNSGLDSLTAGNILLENASTAGGQYVIENCFCNYQSGGIYHTGKRRALSLDNVHQPRFLKSIDGLTEQELKAFITANNSYYEIGDTNLNRRTAIKTEKHNVRYGWNMAIPYDPSLPIGIASGYGKYYLYARKKNAAQTTNGTLVVQFIDGTSTSYVYENFSDQWQLFKELSANTVNLTRGGNADSADCEIEFSLVLIHSSLN